MTDPSRRPINVLVVGAGGIAESSHLPALRAHSERVRVVGVVDVDRARAQAMADRWDIPHVYEDLDAGLASVSAATADADRPTLVDICTPPSSHAATVRRCLAAGSWAWCEKPPTLSLREYDEATAPERAGGPYAAFVFQHRFGSVAAHLRSLVAADELGRLTVGVCHTLWYRADAYYDVPWRGCWATEGGGPTMGHGIHQMDLMLHLLGDWREVRAVAPRLERDVETEDVSAAIVTLESGAPMTVINSILSPREESYLRMDFTEATVEVGHLYGYRNADWRITPAPHVDNPQRVAAWWPEQDVASSHIAALGALLDSMARGERPAVSGHDGRRSLELVAGLYQSAFTDHAVTRDVLVPGNPFYDSMDGGRSLTSDEGPVRDWRPERLAGPVRAAVR